MPVYSFISESAPPGAIERFDIFHPGDFNAVVQHVRRQNIGTNGVRYQGYIVPDTHRSPILLAVQVNVGREQTGQQPTTSRQHVDGGQPIGPPTGQPGREGEPRQQMGSFETIPDQHLTSDGGAMYGPLDDGTSMDWVMTSEGPREVPRQ